MNKKNKTEVKEPKKVDSKKNSTFKKKKKIFFIFMQKGYTIV